MNHMIRVFDDTASLRNQGHMPIFRRDKKENSNFEVIFCL